MKVLWFTHTPCGATEKLLHTEVTGVSWLVTLSKKLMNLQNVDLHIAFYWGSQEKSFCYDGITYHPVLKEGEGRTYTRALNRFKMLYGSSNEDVLMQRLIQVVNEVNPDVIHIHGSEENFGLLAEHLNSNNMVLSIQGLMSPYYEKYYSGISKYQSLKSDSITKWIKCRNTSQEEALFKVKSDIEKRIFKTVPNIIGRTFWDKRCSLSLNPQRRYYEVGEILRPEFYNASWEQPANDKCIIVTTISYGLYKGLESIYKSAEILKKAGFDFEWNVIGVSKNNDYTKLVRNTCKINENDVCIKLLGRKNAAEMVNIMKEANMFVQVSHIENSPNSLCEAMVLGMPIIATYAGGTESLLTNNVEGWLIQDGDPYVMAGSILELYSDSEMSSRFAVKAKEKARMRHNPDLIVDQLMNVYNKIRK